MVFLKVNERNVKQRPKIDKITQMKSEEQVGAVAIATVWLLVAVFWSLESTGRIIER